MWQLHPDAKKLRPTITYREWCNRNQNTGDGVYYLALERRSPLVGYILAIVQVRDTVFFFPDGSFAYDRPIAVDDAKVVEVNSYIGAHSHRYITDFFTKYGYG